MKFPRNLEAAYWADLGPEQIRVLRLSCALGCGLFLAFVGIDYWAIPSTYHWAWCIRALVISATVAVWIVAERRPQIIVARHTLVVGGLYLVWVFGVLAMVSLSQRTELAWKDYYCGIFLACSAIGVSYMPQRSILIVASTFVAGYAFVAIWIQGMFTSQDSPTFILNFYLLISATIVGVVVASIRDRHTRELFLLRQALNRDMEIVNEAKRQSEYLAEHDALTEMPNRIRFMRELEAMIGYADETDITVSLLFIDLDGFKPINDRFGHQIGDMVLRVVANRIRSTVRSIDHFARLGGDEFVVAIGLDPQHLSSADRIRQSLASSIANVMGVEGCEVSVTASIGTAIYPYDADNAVELLSVADARMYEVKRRSKAAVKSAPPVAIAQTPGTAFNASTTMAGHP